MKKELTADEKFKKRLEQVKFIAEHFDEMPYEFQIDYSARADLAADLFVRKKVG